jgi:hypothetical protein
MGDQTTETISMIDVGSGKCVARGGEASFVSSILSFTGDATHV